MPAAFELSPQPQRCSPALAQLLAAHGGDLTALPATFTRTRKPESQAQRWLDKHTHVV